MYQVLFSATARDRLKRLDKPIAQRILDRIKWLGEHFADIEPEALSGELRAFYKFRVGPYRIIYTANRPEQSLTIHFIGHRREVYKRPSG